MSSSPPSIDGGLRIDCSFESGNVERVETSDNIEYDISIRPDSANSKYSVWFYFRVSHTRAQQRVIFHIMNYSKKKTLFREGLSPVVRSTSRWKWQRIPSKHVYYHRCLRHASNCMSFTFCFDREADDYFFAYSFPYTYHDLQRYLNYLDSQQLSIYHRFPLCSSVQGRRVECVVISSPDNLHRRRVEGRLELASEPRTLAVSIKRKCVFFTARIHPGETPSSYVMQGIIDFLLSHDAVARALREHCVFYIVPMLNPDGVYLGNYRCNSLGYDLNRHWHSPSITQHPSIAHTKHLLLQLGKDTTLDLDFFIDIHAHTTSYNCFLYCNSESDRYRQNIIEDFPRMLECYNSNFFEFTESKTLGNQIERAGTGRRAMGDFLSFCQTCCYTLEVSFFCSQKNSRKSEPYSQATYAEIGKTLLRTMAMYMKIPYHSINKTLAQSNNSYFNNNNNGSYNNNNNSSSTTSASSSPPPPTAANTSSLMSPSSLFIVSSPFLNSSNTRRSLPLPPSSSSSSSNHPNGNNHVSHANLNVSAAAAALAASSSPPITNSVRVARLYSNAFRAGRQMSNIAAQKINTRME